MQQLKATTIKHFLCSQIEEQALNAQKTCNKEQQDPCFEPFLHKVEPQNAIPHFKEGPRVRLCPSSDQSEYEPGKKEERVERKIEFQDESQETTILSQNIIPNNINHILAFLQRKSKSESIVKRIIQKLKFSSFISPKLFYVYQKSLKEHIEIHVDCRSLRKLLFHLNLHSQIFSVDQQIRFNLISRILVAHYIDNMAVLVTLSSKRLQKTKKSDHLKGQRIIRRFLALPSDQD